MYARNDNHSYHVAWFQISYKGHTHVTVYTDITMDDYSHFVSDNSLPDVEYCRVICKQTPHDHIYYIVVFRWVNTVHLDDKTIYQDYDVNNEHHVINLDDISVDFEIDLDYIDERNNYTVDNLDNYDFVNIFADDFDHDNNVGFLYYSNRQNQDVIGFIIIDYSDMDTLSNHKFYVNPSHLVVFLTTFLYRIDVYCNIFVILHISEHLLVSPRVLT